MATKSLDQILRLAYVSRVISRIKTPRARMCRFFGCTPGGPNIKPVPYRNTDWDIFNTSRNIANMRPPGTGPGTVAKTVVGHVSATLARAHDKIIMTDEELFRIRVIGQSYGSVDERGQAYIRKQEKNLSQNFANFREFLISRMIRGKFQLLRVGDDWIPVDSGGHVTIDFQNPYLTTGSPNTLAQQKAVSLTLVGCSAASTPFDGMDGTAWTSGAGDPIADYFGINAGFEATHGWPLTDAWCNSTTIRLLMINTVLKNAAGTANIVFNQFERKEMFGPDGNPDTGHTVVFRALPMVTWHVCDDGLNVYNGTGMAYNRLFPSNYVAFMPKVDSEWFELHEGTELVRENILDQGSPRTGLAGWAEPRTQPGGFDLLALDNCLPALYIPGCIAYLQVAG